MPINDDLEGYDPHAAVLEMQRTNEQLRAQVAALTSEVERLRGERDRAARALDDAEKYIRVRRDGFRRFPARPCCAEENDASLQLIAEARTRHAAAPPESEPAPSEPEALREARKLLEQTLGAYGTAQLLLLDEVRAWLARHPGPQPEDK